MKFTCNFSILIYTNAVDILSKKLYIKLILLNNHYILGYLKFYQSFYILKLLAIFFNNRFQTL